MPYRRLPNTDKARQGALEKSYRRFKKDDPNNLAYSEASLTQLRTFLPKFKNELINLNAARKNQVLQNKKYLKILRKSRMYVSHYIQVMNLAITRGELKESIRTHYGLEDYGNILPPLSAEQDLLKWGKLIIEGDRERIMNGGNPIYNPSIAVVKANFEKFSDAYFFQKKLQSSTERFSSRVYELREEADQLILQMWNEIEKTFESQTESKKRELSEHYGILYVYRKSERKKAEAMKLQQELNI